MSLPRAFGPYTLLRRLAVGGMAEIYVAKTRGLGGFEKLVALKLVHPHLSADPHFVQMLIDEAKILVLLAHANVAQVFDLGCIEGTYFISMEYVEGLDVHALQKAAARAAQELPIPVCCHIVAEMLNGLDYAHRRRDASGRPLNIVHRDVSPQNVLISHAGEVKLVDFGIAKTSLSVEGTEVGVIKGKYYYMSPEQAWADPIDRRSDVFSTGIVLYEMLTGRMLYSARSIPELIGKVRAANIPPPTVLRPEIPEALERIVMKALERDANARFQSALDMAEALRDFLYETAPAFNSSRLAQYVSGLLEAQQRVSMEAGLAPHAEEAGQLEALSRDEFVRTENSVLFALENAPFARSQGQTQAGKPRGKRNTGQLPSMAPPPPPRISTWPLEPTDVEPPTEKWRGSLVPPAVAPALAQQNAFPYGARAPSASGAVPSLVPAAPFGASRHGTTPPTRRTLPPPPRPEDAEPTGQYRPRHMAALSQPVQPARLSIPPAFASARNSVPLGPSHTGVPTPALMPPPGEVGAFTPIPPSPPVPDFSSESLFPRRTFSKLYVKALLGMALTVAGVLGFRLASGDARPPLLEIVSVPQGAAVRVDGTLQEGRTPLRISGLNEGQVYVLRVELPGHLPWEASYLATPGAVQHIAVLRPITGELHITSTPSGATVYLDDAAIGKTPLTVSSLALGRTVRLRVHHPGYAEAQREVTVRDTKATERFTLTQPLHPRR